MDMKAVAAILEEATKTNPLSVFYEHIMIVTFEMSETMIENLKKTLSSIGYHKEIPKNLTLEICVDNYLSEATKDNTIVFNSERLNTKKRFITGEIIGLNGHFTILDMNGKFASVL